MTILCASTNSNLPAATPSLRELRGGADAATEHTRATGRTAASNRSKVANHPTNRTKSTAAPQLEPPDQAHGARPGPRWQVPLGCPHLPHSGASRRRGLPPAPPCRPDQKPAAHQTQAKPVVPGRHFTALACARILNRRGCQAENSACALRIGGGFLTICPPMPVWVRPVCDWPVRWPLYSPRPEQASPTRQNCMGHWTGLYEGSCGGFYALRSRPLPPAAGPFMHTLEGVVPSIQALAVSCPRLSLAHIWAALAG